MATSTTYTTVAGKIPLLLRKIRDVGVPDRVTGQWLKTLGFTSSNDQTLSGVLRLIQFTDGNGAPTELWRQYRSQNSKQVLAEAIRKGYADLFAFFPDANKRSQVELNGFFAQRTDAGAQVIGRLVATFKLSSRRQTFRLFADQLKSLLQNTTLKQAMKMLQNLW